MQAASKSKGRTFVFRDENCMDFWQRRTFFFFFLFFFLLLLRCKKTTYPMASINFIQFICRAFDVHTLERSLLLLFCARGHIQIESNCIRINNDCEILADVRRRNGRTNNCHVNECIANRPRCNSSYGSPSMNDKWHCVATEKKNSAQRMVSIHVHISLWPCHAFYFESFGSLDDSKNDSTIFSSQWHL